MTMQLPACTTSTMDCHDGFCLGFAYMLLVNLSSCNAEPKLALQ